MSNTCGITVRMAKAQGAPISIKPGEELLALVDAWAKARGITRHAAILQLIRAGLGLGAARVSVSLPPSHKMSGAKPVKSPIAAREPEPRPAFQSRLKGEWKAP